VLALGTAFLLGFAAFVWCVFIAWRWWIVMKSAAITSGRNYERSGRYKLPPEYADSEDALMVEQRRKERKSTPPPR